MSAAARLVPKWARIVTFLLALANIAFGVMGYLKTDVLFKDLSAVPGLAADNPLLVHASQEFSARNLAIGIALLIVSLVGVPESIAIVMVVRALIELQSLIMAATQGAGIGGLAMPGGFVIVELIVIVAMFRIVRQRDEAKA